VALGVITVISCAVDALWRAFAPGLAKETLPTKTLWTTVLETRTSLVPVISNGGSVLTGTKITGQRHEEERRGQIMR
jgi:hypothetical protein